MALLMSAVLQDDRNVAKLTPYMTELLLNKITMSYLCAGSCLTSILTDIIVY